MYKIENQIYFITFCYLDTFFDHNRQVWAMSNQLLVCTSLSRRDFSLSILSTFIKVTFIRYIQEYPETMGKFEIDNMKRNLEKEELETWNGSAGPLRDRGTKGGLAGFLRAAQCFSKFRGGALRFSLTASRSLSARVTRVYHSRPLPVISIIPLSFPFVHRIAHEEARKERGVSGTLKLDL